MKVSADTSSVSTRGQYMTLIAAFLGWLFDGFELGLLPLVARPALNELLAAEIEERGAAYVDLWEGVWTAGFLVGMSTGGVLFGWLGDRIGRVRAMTLSVLAYSIFSGLCCFAGSAESFFAYRFVAALGMGGEWSLGVALVMEIWPNKSRALLAGLIGAAANVGFLIVAVFALVLGRFIQSAGGWLAATGLPADWVEMLVANQGWRLLMLLGAAPAVLTFFIRLMVPESEKWLHQQKQGATSNWAARDLLAVFVGALGALLIVYVWLGKYSAPVRLGGSAVGLLAALGGYLYPVYRYLQRSQLVMRPLGAAGGPGFSEHRTDVDENGNPYAAPRSPQSKGSFSSEEIRYDMRGTMSRLIIGAVLSGVALIGTWASVQRAPSWANDLARAEGEKAGLAPAEVDQLRTSARAKTQIYSGIGAIFGTMAGALLGNAIGRRPTYVLLCLGALGSSLLFFLSNTTVGPLFLATVFLAGGMTASFYGWLPLYLPELFATRVRATGQGFSFNFGRILAAVAALQTGTLIGIFKDQGGLPMACSIMSLVYLVGVFAIWLAPETHGKPLPE